MTRHYLILDSKRYQLEVQFSKWDANAFGDLFVGALAMFFQVLQNLVHG